MSRLACSKFAKTHLVHVKDDYCMYQGPTICVARFRLVSYRRLYTSVRLHYILGPVVQWGSRVLMLNLMLPESNSNGGFGKLKILPSLSTLSSIVPAESIHLVRISERYLANARKYFNKDSLVLDEIPVSLLDYIRFAREPLSKYVPLTQIEEVISSGKVPDYVSFIDSRNYEENS